jgi:tyrosinase
VAGLGSSFVRRDIWSLQPNDVTVAAYANAVKRMRERPEDDPTSWTYQAAMHGTHAKPNKPGWNECQHGTWFFLPWHRMFLYYFEKIVRATVIEDGGPADWALPYWNYGLGGEKAKLPLAFREPKLANGDDNPLYVAERAEGMNSGEGFIPALAGSPAKALARPAFIGKAEFGGDRTAPAQFAESGGELEETPHNIVHGLVGGRGLMGDILRAAQDPIFWLHHANIDRIWSDWIGTASHQNPPDGSWRGQIFSFFDEHSQPTSLRCDQVLETITDLDYTYDTEPSPPTPPPGPTPTHPTVAAVSKPEREMIGATEQEVVLTGEQISVPVLIDAQAAEPLGQNVHAYLNVEEIEGESNPGTGYAVYADLQSGRPMDAQSSHHVGNLSFFGIERAREPAGDQAPHALQSSFEITAIAHELQARGEWAGHELWVTFEPLGLLAASDTAEVASPNHEDRPVQLGRISVFYDA